MLKLVYPWDAMAIINDKDTPAATRSLYAPVLDNFFRYFKQTPDYFLSLQGTKSHALAEDILAYIYRPIKPSWFTALMVSQTAFPYIRNVLQLVCLTYSLTSGSSTFMGFADDVAKQYHSYGRDDDTALFDLICDAGICVLQGADTASVDENKVSGAYDTFFQSRIDSKEKRTILVCNFTTAAVKDNSLKLAADMAFINGVDRVSISQDDVVINRATALTHNYRLYPNHIDPAKVTLPENKFLDLMASARAGTMHSIKMGIGRVFGERMASYSDTLYIY